MVTKNNQNMCVGFPCLTSKATLESELPPVALILSMKPYEQVQEEDRKVAYLDWLYLMDRRDSPEHPLHARYTGLREDRIKAIVKAEFDFVTKRLF